MVFLSLWLAAGQAFAQPASAQAPDPSQDRLQPGPQSADLPRAAAPTIAPLANDVPLGYFIAGATPAAGSDAELCAWALDDWVRQAEGRLEVRSAAEAEALIRIYLVSPGFALYGEMRPILVGDRRGAEVYVRTETESLGPGPGPADADPLLRETIVYLTCLHEIGHALGMVHTDVFEDVMYYFGFGGDVAAFFDRYRSRLESRGDIARVSGLSAGDIAQLLGAYPEN